VASDQGSIVRAARKVIVEVENKISLHIQKHVIMLLSIATYEPVITELANLGEEIRKQEISSVCCLAYALKV
jgi:flagellar biosynthesis regulator FlbT